MRIQDTVHAVYLFQAEQLLLERQPLSSPLAYPLLLRLSCLLFNLVVIDIERTQVILVALAPIRHVVQKLADRCPQARLLNRQ